MQVNKIIKLCHILVYASLNFNIYAYQFQCIILLNAEKIIKLCDSICMCVSFIVLILMGFDCV